MPTLDEVAVTFQEWRGTKKKKYERIPDELIAMAKGLVGEHTAGVVAMRLGIRAAKLCVSVEKKSRDSEKFIEVPMPAPPPVEGVVIVRVRPDCKNEISITLTVNNLNWSEFLRGLSRL